MTKVYLPAWLYHFWPWLALIMGVAFGLIGHHFVFLAFSVYASWVLIRRAVAQTKHGHEPKE